ncbi:50S ribosomal protein L33 [Patescibacteria group bacterium]
MAKKEQRQIFGLVCTKCKSSNYVTERNKINTTDKLVLKKYCKRCRSHTEHKEKAKLH